MIPKLARGGIIKIPTKPIRPEESIFMIFKTQQEMIEKIEHQKKIIDRLSRKIQRKNQEYRKLKAKKMPPTLYGREVIIVPDSKAKDIMLVSKDIFDIGDLK